MDKKLDEKTILDALKQVEDPDLKKNIVSLNFIKDLKISSENKVSFTLELTTPACPFKGKMKEQAEKLVREIPGVQDVEIQLTSRVRSTVQENTKNNIPGIKNIIVVGSGKGGVGKSTVSVNLAIALSQTGANVGLLDADIYGPSIPKLLSLDPLPDTETSGKICSVYRYGIRVMSIGLLLPPKKAVVWRGPMLDKMLKVLLYEVDWGDLDYLVVDLPPGTGDVQMTLCQNLQLSGAVVVSTPQGVAIEVAVKAMDMFQKLQCPVLGILENMSYYICNHCSQKEYIFGMGSTRQVSEEWHIPFLGEVPLCSQIRYTSDQGIPITISDPNSEGAKAFQEIASKISAQVSIKNFQE
ncbi:MAG: Mrp/NBP35 family ATP-binding protein [Candidatus Brocadiae bacterium]|nr:Mrp/NBP35 family ATP-binding protein [Candidatus Brocadiia bacterium]